MSRRDLRTSEQRVESPRSRGLVSFRTPLDRRTVPSTQAAASGANLTAFLACASPWCTLARMPKRRLVRFTEESPLHGADATSVKCRFSAWPATRAAHEHLLASECQVGTVALAYYGAYWGLRQDSISVPAHPHPIIPTEGTCRRESLSSQALFIQTTLPCGNKRLPRTRTAEAVSYTG